MLLLLLACAHTSAPPPAPAPAADRAALPEATMRVYLGGTGRLGAGAAYRGGRGDPLPLQVYTFVIDHPTQGRIVIDPGYGRRTVRDPGDVPGRAVARFSGLQVSEAMADTLADGPPVAHLLLTHGHVDHAGGIEDFPGATLHIDPAEWRFLQRRRTLRATEPPLDPGALEIAPLAFDDGPYGPFPRHEDVFGDGSLLALATPGHTPGHTSFLIQLPGGSFLLTGDVAWFDPHWRELRPKGRFASGLIEVDGGANAEAAAWIHALSAADPELVVLSGHDLANQERIEVGRTYR